MLIDQTPFPTLYGFDRADVVDYFKQSALPGKRFHRVDRRDTAAQGVEHGRLACRVLGRPMLSTREASGPSSSTRTDGHRIMRKTELFFDSIADDFLERMNQFDQQARVDWFDRALRRNPLAEADDGRRRRRAWPFLDVGQRHGATVVPVDIAPRLSAGCARRFPAALVASATSLPFETGSVDFVVSSECIEHTPDPRRAVREMLRVLRPGGVLFLTTPNLLWRWSVGLAELLRIRRFEGIENWLSRPALRRTIVESGGEISPRLGCTSSRFS